MQQPCASHRAALDRPRLAPAAAVAVLPGARAGNPLRATPASKLPSHWARRFGRLTISAVAAEAPAKPAAAGEGHSALLQGLGEVGDVAPVHMPWLLRLAHVKSKIAGGDSNTALQESARGLLLWKVCPAFRGQYHHCLGGRQAT